MSVTATAGLGAVLVAALPAAAGVAIAVLKFLTAKQNTDKWQDAIDDAKRFQENVRKVQSVEREIKSNPDGAYAEWLRRKYKIGPRGGGVEGGNSEQ